MFSVKIKVIGVIVVLVLLWAGCRIHSRKVNNWEIVNLSAKGGTIICFGDSLVDGVGAKAEDSGYPAQLAKLLQREVLAYGVPGETAERGWQRLRESPEISNCPVIVTLGGNDLLQRKPWSETEQALSGIFAELQRRGCLVAYTGVEALGVDRQEHRQLCKENGVILIPDVLGGITGSRNLKHDQIHPNDAGYAIFAGKVSEFLQPFLD